MDGDALRQLDADGLADYVWRRLRPEPPVDPPVSDRFGVEPPEQCLILAFEESRDRPYYDRLVNAVRDNIRRLAQLHASASTSIWQNPVTDQQLASLAFLASKLKADDLVPDLYLFVLPWLMEGPAREFSDGQFHILRTLAHLQGDGKLADMWRSLWESGPRSSRGLAIYGWARTNPDQALAHLGELADMGDQINLPAAVWSLLDPQRPGLHAVARAAARLTSRQRSTVRTALHDAGADYTTLRDFDLAAAPSGGDADGFPFPPATEPADAEDACHPPKWAA